METIIDLRKNTFLVMNICFKLIQFFIFFFLINFFSFIMTIYFLLPKKAYCTALDYSESFERWHCISQDGLFFNCFMLRKKKMFSCGQGSCLDEYILKKTAHKHEFITVLSIDKMITIWSQAHDLNTLKRIREKYNLLIRR